MQVAGLQMSRNESLLYKATLSWLFLGLFYCLRLRRKVGVDIILYSMLALASSISSRSRSYRLSRCLFLRYCKT